MAPTMSKLLPGLLPGVTTTAPSHQKPDVEFKVSKNGGSYSSFLAHRNILASSSSVFKVQCSNPTIYQVTIQITDFSQEVLSAYLKFLYADGDHDLFCEDTRNLFQLFSFAVKYGVRDLQEEIIMVLKNEKVGQRNFLELVGILEDNKHLESASAALKQSLNDFIALNLKSVEDLSKIVLNHLSSTGSLSIPILELLKDAKKTVRFSDSVQKQTYNINSAILSNTAKNKKKAEKKRKALEKRNSECESSSVDETVLERQEIVQRDISGESFDSSNDSGLASSFEESINLNFDLATCDEEHFGEILLNEVEQSCPFKTNSEFIFNLDF